jgi:predicted lipoprotein with Yx(FWY)xxD motif
MKKFSNSFIGMTAILVTTSAMISCNKGNSYSGNNPYPSATSKEIVLQNNGTVGNYLTDKDNKALYFFSNDANGKDSCTDGCEAFWPVFNVNNLTADQLGAGLNISDFTNVTSASGKAQLAYKGWPLYHYAPFQNGTNVIEGPGLIQGDGIDGIWYVAKPDYSIMLVNSQLTGTDGKNYRSDYTEGIGKTIYFTDGEGRTLYTFTHDSLNTNKFTKSDFSNNNVWPVYETELKSIPSTLDKSKFGSINFFGKNQITYQGWPLYHFGQDATTRGSNKGVSFPQPGLWHVTAKGLIGAPHL